MDQRVRKVNPGSRLASRIHAFLFRLVPGSEWLQAKIGLAENMGMIPIEKAAVPP